MIAAHVLPHIFAFPIAHFEKCVDVGLIKESNDLFIGQRIDELGLFLGSDGPM